MTNYAPDGIDIRKFLVNIQNRVVYIMIVSKTRLLIKCRTFRVPNWHVEVISYSFGIIFGQKTQEHVKTIKKHCLETENEIIRKNVFKNMFSSKFTCFGSKADFLM